MKHSIQALVVGGLLFAAGPASAETLNMAVGADVTSLDPHFHNISPNNAFNSQIFEPLIERDPEGRPTPALALSWEPVEDNVWEFKLRPDVTFHNGSAFTANDVAFTLARIPKVLNSPGSFSTYVASIDSTEVVDDLTVRFHTKFPDPLLPSNIASVLMLDDDTHADATTETFNSGEGMIGTGPFKYVSHVPSEVVVLARNDGYWGETSDFETVNYRMVTDGAARVASLLTGANDFIDQPPTSDLAMLRSRDDLKVTETDSLRLFYLLFDQTGDARYVTSMDGTPLTGEDNPLLKPDVRKALSLAIDRQAIAERIMEGAATPTGQFMPKGTTGWDEDVAVPEGDVAEAKRLLADAGYPDGFRLTLHGSNDRYPNDSLIDQAVGQMWTRIGVPTEVIVAPYSAYISHASRQEYSAFQGSWGSSTGDPIVGYRSVLHSWNPDQGLGSVNRGRYRNDRIDELITTAASTLDEARRNAVVDDITEEMVADTAIIPIHHQINYWAMRKWLTHEPRADELTRAQDVGIDETVER